MNMSPEHSSPNLYLIGFMGVGKSAVGRYVARMLHMRFIDSDHAIESKTGMSISSIFETRGEAEFRKMERDFIQNGHPGSGCVVSCGGGLPIEPGMDKLLMEKGVVVCLFASEETIIKRTSANNKRPLLNGDDTAQRVHTILNKRLPIYMRTGTGISTENRNLPEIAGHVMRIYRKQANRDRFKHID